MLISGATRAPAASVIQFARPVLLIKEENGQDPCGENQNAPRNAAYTFLLVDAAGKEHDNKTCEGYPCVCEPECFCEDPAKNDRDKNDKRNDLLGIKLLGRRYVGFRNGCSCLDNVSRPWAYRG